MPNFKPCQVTVSIPYFRCKPYIRRAVESILGQTYPHFTVVVVNDGDEEPPWDQLADIDDPRLVRFDLQGNHGPYFANAVVLNATTDPYFLIQDADDWSEPERISILLRKIREDHADAAISASFHYKLIKGTVGERKELTYPKLNSPLTKKFEFRSHHTGLFKAASLRDIGGYYGGFRFGYDTLIVNLLLTHLTHRRI